MDKNELIDNLNLVVEYLDKQDLKLFSKMIQNDVIPFIENAKNKDSYIKGINTRIRLKSERLKEKDREIEEKITEIRMKNVKIDKLEKDINELKDTLLLFKDIIDTYDIFIKKDTLALTNELVKKYK